MNVVVFTNQKGGPGKTTLSVLYAHWLADRLGRRVAFIDLDSQCNASKTLRRFDAGVLAMSLFGEVDAIFGQCHEGVAPAASVMLFAGSAALVELERAAPVVVIPAFRTQVAALADAFDAVVIDTPPALGLRMSAALIAADFVVCPIELEEYSLDGVTAMLRTVFGVRQRHNPGLRLAGIVANRFNPHSVRQKEALGRLLVDYGEFVVPAKISTRSAIPEALAAGVPVWRLNKSAAREASAEVLTVFGLLRERMPSASDERAAALAGDGQVDGGEARAADEMARGGVRAPFAPQDAAPEGVELT